MHGRSKYEKIFVVPKTYGKWIAQPGVYMDEQSRAYVLCNCTNPNCSTLEFVACHHILLGKSTQCKRCNNSEKTRGKSLNPNWRGTGEVSKTYLSHISTYAARGHHPYDLTVSYASTLLNTSNNTCTVSGEPISFTAGTAELVPINHATGYVENNVMWVHKNIAPAIKKTKHANEFIDMCVKIAQKKRTRLTPSR